MDVVGTYIISKCEWCAASSPASADVTRSDTQWSDRLHIDCRQLASCGNYAPAPETACCWWYDFKTILPRWVLFRRTSRTWFIICLIQDNAKTYCNVKQCNMVARTTQIWWWQEFIIGRSGSRPAACLAPCILKFGDHCECCVTAVVSFMSFTTYHSVIRCLINLSRNPKYARYKVVVFFPRQSTRFYPAYPCVYAARCS